MILTSVIPPELPIELSLAVINSLTALTQSLIFCTEPFRIPLAGKVDVCCFDKTGTLTSDNLVIKGVAAAPPPPPPAPAPAGDEVGDEEAETGGAAESSPAGKQANIAKAAGGKAPAAAAAATATVSVAELGEVPTRILAGCHSLVTLNGTLVGDSVEVATLKGLGWGCLRGGLVVPRASARTARDARRERARDGGTDAGARDSPRGSGSEALGAEGPDAALQPLQVLHSWAFDPSLRRMCTAVSLAGGGAGGAGGGAPAAAAGRGEESTAAGGGVPPFHDRLWIVAKGAPESLEPLLSDAPPNYRSTFLHHMGQGSRVLALAYRALEPGVDAAACRRMSRASAERGLRFGGFLVLGCPLKPDAPYVVRELRESSHSVCMITGDGALTAADVARQVGMIDQPPSRTLLLSVSRSRNGGNGGERAGAQEAGRSVKAGGRATDASLCWVSLAAGGSGGSSGNGDGDGGGIPFDSGSIATLARRHALCVTGDVLSQVSAVVASTDVSAVHQQATNIEPGKASAVKAALGTGSSSTAAVAAAAPSSALSSLCSHVAVFARVSPAQKELIIGELNASGNTTVMCGDGTNDVGALRRAHVGG